MLLRPKESEVSLETVASLTEEMRSYTADYDEVVASKGRRRWELKVSWDFLLPFLPLVSHTLLPLTRA